jgi:hypothetical protein
MANVPFRTTRRRCIKAFNQCLAIQHRIVRRNNGDGAELSATMLKLLKDMKGQKRAKYNT